MNPACSGIFFTSNGLILPPYTAGIQILTDSTQGGVLGVLPSVLASISETNKNLLVSGLEENSYGRATTQYLILLTGGLPPIFSGAGDVYELRYNPPTCKENTNYSLEPWTAIGGLYFYNHGFPPLFPLGAVMSFRVSEFYGYFKTDNVWVECEVGETIPKVEDIQEWCFVPNPLTILYSNNSQMPSESQEPYGQLAHFKYRNSGSVRPFNTRMIPELFDYYLPLPYLSPEELLSLLGPLPPNPPYPPFPPP